MKRIVSLVTLLVLAACHRTATPVDDAGAAPDASAPAHALSTSDAGGLDLLAAGAIGHGIERMPAPLVIPSGTAAPMPAGASPPDREKEIVGLLSGNVAPDALPVVPTDTGESFDEGLRTRLMSPTRFEAGVTFSAVEVKGPLTQTDVTRVLASAARPRARNCYRNALESNPELQGELHVKLDVAPNGEVKSATEGAPPTGNLATSGPLRSCMLGVVKRLYFPSVDAGTTTGTFTAHFEAHMDNARR